MIVSIICKHSLCQGLNVADFVQDATGRKSLSQRMREVLLEVSVLNKIHHPNVVKFMGLFLARDHTVAGYAFAKDSLRCCRSRLCRLSQSLENHFLEKPIASW